MADGQQRVVDLPDLKDISSLEDCDESNNLLPTKFDMLSSVQNGFPPTTTQNDSGDGDQKNKSAAGIASSQQSGGNHA